MNNEEIKLFESLKSSCNELFEIVQELQSENAFLTDTIEKNNLGTIAAERRNLISLAEEAEEEKTRYEAKNRLLDKMVADNRNRRDYIAKYIDKKAEEKTAEIRQEYRKKTEEYRRKCEIECERNGEENRQLLEMKTAEAQKKSRIVTAVSVGIAFVCILIEVVSHI